MRIVDEDKVSEMTFPRGAVHQPSVIRQIFAHENELSMSTGIEAFFKRHSYGLVSPTSNEKNRLRGRSIKAKFTFDHFSSHATLEHFTGSVPPWGDGHDRASSHSTSFVSTRTSGSCPCCLPHTHLIYT